MYYSAVLFLRHWQANLAVQEARYEAAMKDLNKAQDQLDDKQRELEAVQAQYDQAMAEKQVCKSARSMVYCAESGFYDILKKGFETM
jgi:lipid II:glycine glycyltransferase (peptidoglycan interpeptide bridge formation enzyme)